MTSMIEKAYARPPGSVMSDNRFSQRRVAGVRSALARSRRALGRSRRRAANLQLRFNSVFAHSPDAVYFLDPEGRFVSVNASCERCFGYTADELIGLAASSLVMPDQVASLRADFLTALGGTVAECEVAMKHKSGRRIEMHVSSIPILTRGRCIGVYGVAKELTLRRRLIDLTRLMNSTSSVEGQVKLMLGMLDEVLPYDSGGLYWVDHTDGVLRPNTLVAADWVSHDLGTFDIPLAQGIFGEVARSSTGVLVNNAHLDPRSIYPPGAVVECEHLVAVPVIVDGHTVGLFYIARKSNPTFSESDFEVVQLFIGHAAAAIEKMYAFEQMRASEERFHHQALHDPLTHLPNRVLLHDRLGQAILSAQRESRSVSLLVLDLNNFKEVNDTLGHDAGDRLLQEVAARLRGALRSSDTVARLGGDEFAAVLTDADEAAAEHSAANLQAALEAPLVLDDFELSVGASIGIATYPALGEDTETLLRNADIAMYAAKRARRGVAIYSPDHESHSSERRAMVSALRRGIRHDELSLHYQPQIECASGHLASVEALVRWWHPERGLLGPDHFVPLAEQSGLIRQLTCWVLATALGQSGRWRQMSHDIGLSVNLSSKDLLDETLPEYVAAQLQRWSFPGEMLTLEITESALLADQFRAVDVLQQIRRLGVRVALDDFGTGYSSLSCLSDWPVDEVKVDRSCVRNLVADPRNRAIVRATIELAHSLGLEVVAEGVEDAASLEVLIEMGTDRAQGYHIARPLPPTELLGWCQGYLFNPTIAKRPSGRPLMKAA